MGHAPLYRYAKLFAVTIINIYNNGGKRKFAFKGNPHAKRARNDAARPHTHTRSWPTFSRYSTRDPKPKLTTSDRGFENHGPSFRETEGPCTKTL